MEASTRFDLLIITGCFMLFYMRAVDYTDEIARQSHVLTMVENLSDAQQRELYDRLLNDLKTLEQL